METVSPGIRYRLTRAKCVLIGCICAENYPGCYRCQEGLYEGDFIQYGKLDWVFRLYDRWLYWRRRIALKLGRAKCDQCGKKYWRGHDDRFCSEECFDDFIPF